MDQDLGLRVGCYPLSHHALDCDFFRDHLRFSSHFFDRGEPRQRRDHPVGKGGIASQHAAGAGADPPPQTLWTSLPAIRRRGTPTEELRRHGLTTGKLDDFSYFEGVGRWRRVTLLSHVDRCGWVDRFCPYVSIPGHREQMFRGPNQSEETPVL